MMECKRDNSVRTEPRLIIHGGAGNISRATMTPERYRAYRSALTEIISRSRSYMMTEIAAKNGNSRRPSALESATFAVVLFEDNSLFNSGHGAVFTRDGINELEASVMVSRGRAKRGVGVMGLRRVKNPILLARRMLEHGDVDLGGRDASVPSLGNSSRSHGSIDAPSAQGHTQIYGATAEALAERYGLPLVEPSYFFTQTRWDEHVRALEREKEQQKALKAGCVSAATASWSADEYLPQGTCGAVALDEDGVVCCATTTGGLTNKLTGRVGDTPVVGAGSWAETWSEAGDPTAAATARPIVELSGALRSLLADCLPIPMPISFQYSSLARSSSSTAAAVSTTTRSLALSGTGNGDSFLRVSAAHTVAAMARFRPVSSAEALSAVAGPGGLLQESAGDRWGRTGEGEGGLIGIESVVVRDKRDGAVLEVRSSIIQDCNCGGMFRAWIDDDGQTQVRVFRDEMQ
ncbi:L-asparaginase precursor [Grosmannia clavigera kw1407]|uniref:L-asparaginase n=1 Tax=Grosmannia clavigera (strain kw1407 / UAMH 11150) TaxID=655863 RepID=F0XFI2_GROCL|nr:L-asparaginase precursor [Grosmannia clavigera kw1407]EFX04060.1 L-asparaginase precursor [Grosmannia clavigera kw1407]